jgi:hypothetical protein
VSEAVVEYAWEGGYASSYRGRDVALSAAPVLVCERAEVAV